MAHGEIGKKQGYIRPADKIVQYLSLLVFFIAFLTGLYCYWYGVDDGYGTINTIILRITAILLISCPCAIGIAAPMAERVPHQRFRERGGDCQKLGESWSSWEKRNFLLR